MCACVCNESSKTEESLRSRCKAVGATIIIIMIMISTLAVGYRPFHLQNHLLLQMLALSSGREGWRERREGGRGGRER